MWLSEWLVQFYVSYGSFWLGSRKFINDYCPLVTQYVGQLYLSK